MLIEQAEKLGEPPEDPLLLFSVLYGFWYASLAAFNGDVARDLAAQFMALAEKQRATIPLMVGHRVVATSSHYTGDIVAGRAHYDQALALYDAAKHRSLATCFGQDIRVIVLSNRSNVLWMLGYPEAALADADQALKDAREVGHAASLMYALALTSLTHLLLGNYAVVNAQADELVAVAEEKSAPLWKAYGRTVQGCILALTGKYSDAVHQITSGIAALQINRINICFADLAINSGESPCGPSPIRRCLALHWRSDQHDRNNQGKMVRGRNVNRIAGEIALKSPEPDATKAEAYFERALATARQQQAKSWELRAAMSLARLWRDQGKVSEARELLAPVYGWFTEGFDTRDLKEAKALLEELAA